MLAGTSMTCLCDFFLDLTVTAATIASLFLKVSGYRHTKVGVPSMSLVLDFSTTSTRF